MPIGTQGPNSWSTWQQGYRLVVPVALLVGFWCCDVCLSRGDGHHALVHGGRESWAFSLLFPFDLASGAQHRWVCSNGWEAQLAGSVPQEAAGSHQMAWGLGGCLLLGLLAISSAGRRKHGWWGWLWGQHLPFDFESSPMEP